MRNNLNTVSAQIRGHSWLNRHTSILFSKICQLLNVLFNKISPQNPNFFISRRPLICADTVVSICKFPIRLQEFSTYFIILENSWACEFSFLYFCQEQCSQKLFLENYDCWAKKLRKLRVKIPRKITSKKAQNNGLITSF